MEPEDTKDTEDTEDIEDTEDAEDTHGEFQEDIDDMFADDFKPDEFVLKTPPIRYTQDYFFQDLYEPHTPAGSPPPEDNTNFCAEMDTGGGGGPADNDDSFMELNWDMFKTPVPMGIPTTPPPIEKKKRKRPLLD